jgi:hypothetical protein
MRRVAILCVGLAAAAAFGAWLYLTVDRPDNSLATALAERAQLGPGTEVDFADVAPFAWDRVYIFGPYTPQQHVDACLGFHWPGFSRTSINESKGRNLVVFVRGKQVVRWFEQPRTIELLHLANGKGYSRDEARFFQIVGTSDRRLELVKRDR